MNAKHLSLFRFSAGTTLLAASTMLVISNLASAGFVLPQDPVSGLSMRLIFSLAAVLGPLATFLCFFSRQRWLVAAFVTWLALIYCCCRLALLWAGYRFTSPFLGPVADAFSLPPAWLARATDGLFVYLLLGGALCLIAIRREQILELKGELLKTSCPSCGGHLQFPSANAGQSIACPHCQASMTLPRSGSLKMSCYFCNGHIVFPSHAAGTKMQCPHCKMDITLKEPA
jgi:ribosomal protein S27E